MIEFVNQISAAWAGYFGLMILQNSVFLLVIFIALMALKNSSAQLKYIVGMAGIVKLLLPPFLPFNFAGLFSSTQPVISANVEVGQFTAIPIAAGSYVPAMDTLGLLFVSWMLMAVLYLVLAFGSTLVLRLKLAAAKPVHANVQQKSELKLFQTQLISTPLSIGLFPRNVFLPSFFKALPKQCQQVLINHELAHIKRKDGFFSIVANICSIGLLFSSVSLAFKRAGE
jgi:beta-lactamase regulating signal transducer with metallopeptidase domain